MELPWAIVSDWLRRCGYAVEISPGAMKDLIRVSIPRKEHCSYTGKMLWIGDRYQTWFASRFSIQDIAQREQQGSPLWTLGCFSKKDGILVLIIRQRAWFHKENKRSFWNWDKKAEGIFKSGSYSILNHSIKTIWLSWRQSCTIKTYNHFSKSASTNI